MAVASNETADVCHVFDIGKVETVTHSSNTFADIQKAVNSAKESDTIDLTEHIMVQENLLRFQNH